MTSVKVKIPPAILHEVVRRRTYDTTCRRYILRPLSADAFEVEVYDLRTLGKTSSLKPIGTETYTYTEGGFRHGF